MALQDIINTITEDAKKKADENKQDFDKKINEIRERGKKRLDIEKEKIDKNIQREKNKVVDRAKLESNIEERNQIVSVKQKLINEVFVQSLKAIGNISENQQILILVNLINQLPDVDDGEIFAAEGKKEITRKAIEQSQKSYTLVEEEFKGAGGFLFKSSTIEVNNSFEELLRGLREEMEIEISTKLFG